MLQKAGKTYNLIKALLGRTRQEDKEGKEGEFPFMRDSNRSGWTEYVELCLEFDANSNFEKDAEVFNLTTTFSGAK